MQVRPLMQPGAFGPEAIAAMGEALEAALKEVQHTGQTGARDHGRADYWSGETW